MTNELLIILSFIVIYGGVALFYRLFGKGGLLAFSIFATLVANIEVLLLVEAFGMEMTLGNVLFGSTFLITDILSENHSRKDANRAVIISTACSILFIAVSQIWLLYTPAANDWASGAFHTIFSNTPRIILASLGVYLVSQLADVWLYHKWWDWCRKRFGDSRSGLCSGTAGRYGYTLFRRRSRTVRGPGTAYRHRPCSSEHLPVHFHRVLRRTLTGHNGGNIPQQLCHLPGDKPYRHSYSISVPQHTRTRKGRNKKRKFLGYATAGNAETAKDDLEGKDQRAAQIQGDRPE